MSCALLTSTRARAARACPRLHHIEYNLGYRPRDAASALRFGSLVHLGLEAWWKAPNNRLDSALHVMRQQKDVDSFEMVRAEEMMRGYDARWLAEADKYEAIAVEAKFETELRNPFTSRVSQNWRLAGKVDAIVRLKEDGRVFLVEHKTASGDVSPGSEYWKRLRMDGQISIYFEGGRALGHDISGCIYDVLGKPLQRPYEVNSKRKVAETPEEFRVRINEAIAEDPAKYFQRGEVVRLEEEMQEAMFDLWQLAQQIRESELAKRAPRNPDACVRYGRTCPYFAVCAGEASLDDPLLFKKLEVSHPELSEGEGRERAAL